MTNEDVTISKHGGCRIGSLGSLSPEFCDAIMDLLAKDAISSKEYESGATAESGGAAISALEGRGKVITGTLPGFGRCIVKCYLRGGLFRYLVAGRYLRMGVTRGEAEFRMLSKVRSLGVNAPTPIAFAYQGYPFYKAWLISAEITGRRSLAEISVRDEDLCMELITPLIDQLSILIRNRVFHVDLHPGNVVVDPSKNVYLLDFDKARSFKGTKNDLRDLYLTRWRRAIIKHRLPDYLAEAVCGNLRRSFEETTN